MKLAEVESAQLSHLLQGEGLIVQTGRFTSRINSSSENISNDILTLYGNTDFIESKLYDFNVEINPGKGLRKWLRPQITFSFSSIQPFTPLPANQATPMLEWGLNWCVSNHYHQNIIIHAAVLEKNGKALILPGQPGAGKSTLCAALAYSAGFRLLSDELTLIELDGSKVNPNPRPVSLKNKSIDIIREMVPGILCTETVHDTQKGSVSLFRPADKAVENANKPAKPGIVLFPKFNPDIAEYELIEVSRPHALVELANQSFNYPVLCQQGFEALSAFIDSSQCFRLEYNGDLAKAIEIIEDLMLYE